MTTDTHRPALRAVEPAAIDTSAECRLAAQHWLLSAYAAPLRTRARSEWQDQGVALFPLGTLFSAVRIPGRLVAALACTSVPADVDAFLDRVLDGGPVICDLYGRRYYALVPASMPATWHQALDDWRAMDVDCLGRGTYLGVPTVDAVKFDPQSYASYWSVPMSSAAVLCQPLNVARLIAAGRHQLHEEPDA
jgi:hypothetical protein